MSIGTLRLCVQSGVTLNDYNDAQMKIKYLDYANYLLAFFFNQSFLSIYVTDKVFLI